MDRQTNASCTQVRYPFASSLGMQPFLRVANMLALLHVRAATV
jgi:hypothetical protein